MKSMIVVGTALWLVLTLELSWPVRLPHGCLLFPLACAAMFWFRDSRGLLLASGFILIDWIIRPTLLPVPATVLPLMGAAIFAAGVRRRRGHDHGIRIRPGLPEPLQLPLFTVLALGLQAVSQLSAGNSSSLTDLMQCLGRLSQQQLPVLIIAVPISAVLSLAFRAADELGLRRPSRQIIL